LRPLSKPLDEAAWQAWVEKSRAQDRRNRAARMKTVKWVSLSVLFAVTALWSHLTPYDGVVRFIVTAGAIVLMFDASHARHYAFAAVFGALALFYNPVVPVFRVSGDWWRAVAVASAAPFVASLAWRKVRMAHND
jgi:hypothetical protein